MTPTETETALREMAEQASINRSPTQQALLAAADIVAKSANDAVAVTWATEQVEKIIAERDEEDFAPNGWGYFSVLRATAEQRAEAFLKTLELWEDDIPANSAMSDGGQAL